MLAKRGKDPHQTASYRPISLLPIFSKILEKIIYDRIKPVIEKKKLIPDHQFGFRNKHSTIEQMHRLVNEIDMETTQNNDENNDLTHYEESWKVVTSSKKRKVTPCISDRKAIVADKQQ